MIISGNQLKAARALAEIEQIKLSELSSISANTIRKMEGRGPERLRVRSDTLEAIRLAFKALNVEFIGLDDGRLGVRLLEPIDMNKFSKNK